MYNTYSFAFVFLPFLSPQHHLCSGIIWIFAFALRLNTEKISTKRRARHQNTTQKTASSTKS